MRRNSAAIWFFALLAYFLTRAAPTQFNEHILQAWAFLHGRAYVDPFQPWEHVVVSGHNYILHPPLSAIICMPFVALSGLDVDQTTISILIGALDVMLAYRLTRSLWLTVLFGFGTVVWYEATLGASWGFALVLSCGPTLLALEESFNRRRPWLVGLWAGLAMLVRYDLVMALPFYLTRVWGFDTKGHSSTHLLHNHSTPRILWASEFLAPVILCAAFYVAYAQVRFGTWTDISLWLWYQIDPYRKIATHGPFSIHYLPLNLYTALFLAPVFNPQWPYVHPQQMGQALVFTSPALLLALRASLRDRTNLMLWLTVGLVMGPALLVYANGFSQMGARYWIQVLPFLLLLIARGGKIDQMGKILILLSVALTGYGLWHVRILGWGA